MSDETIDVLAVMDRAMTQVRHCHEAHEIQEARKAIAELIEAAKEEAAKRPLSTHRLRAALARVGATK